MGSVARKRPMTGWMWWVRCGRTALSPTTQHSEAMRPDACSSLPAWNIFKQIFAEHWDGFKCVYPRYDTRYYDGLVDKMLGCGDPEKMGYIEYRCLQCGEGIHRVAMSCKSSLCLRCAKVYVEAGSARSVRCSMRASSTVISS